MRSTAVGYELHSLNAQFYDRNVEERRVQNGEPMNCITTRRGIILSNKQRLSISMIFFHK